MYDYNYNQDTYLFSHVCPDKCEDINTHEQYMYTSIYEPLYTNPQIHTRNIL